MNRFQRYQLRTTDPESARGFYAEMFGDGFWGDGLDIAALPASAIARGVPAHWLGHIGVEDVVQTMYRFFDAGAARLGAPPPDGRDSAGVVLRDPFGARFALTPVDSTGRRDPRVAWHLLSTRDETSAMELYAGILGWTALDHQDLGDRGRHMTFAWDGTDTPVGSTSDIARRPHVHPQWLYFLRVPDLDASLARVREFGGLTLPAAKTQRATAWPRATTRRARPSDCFRTPRPERARRRSHSRD